MERNKLTISVDGHTVIAEREAHTTKCSDPTHTVRWKMDGPLGFDIVEFQGVYTGTFHGGEREHGSEELVTVHQDLEAAFSVATTWLDNREPDPMGNPSDYE